MSESGPEYGAAAAVSEEDLARANVYGLLSRLFYAPADPELLAGICRNGQSAAGGEEVTALGAAWRRLQEACQHASPAAVQQEHDGLFVGVGKAAVTPYLSAYADASAPDRYLVGLRERLAGWGLARHEGVGEVEDHIAGVADVMRWLIEHGHPLGEQRQFFAQYVYPEAVHFFAGVQNAPAASFFRRVTDLASAFFELEKTAFEMDDGT